MKVLSERRLRSHGLSGVCIGVLACLAGAAPALAAPPGAHSSRASGSTAAGLTSAAPSASALSGALTQMTGLSAGQVATEDACPSAGAGQVRCAAQALVVRSNRKLVRPFVSPRASFTQVFPRSARGIQPEVQAGAAAPQAGTPAYLQQAYDLTYLSQTAGSSDTVAIVDAYDDPNAAADLAVYRATYGLPACTTANGCFRKVNEYGASSPLPAGDLGWEEEESLDLDSVSALCPNCHIVLVEASTNSFADMDQAVTTAAGMANQVSNSWTGYSSSPIPGTYTFPGVAVIAAAGDGGYTGTGGNDYPAAFPGVTAAGGTSLAPSTTGTPSARGWTESAWSDGGSGCNLQEPKPSYQTDTGCTGRSYADVSADADPNTGLIIYDSDNGGWILIGGTSLATPLIAAYEAVTGVNGSTPQWAYTDGALLNDPSTGSNGTCAPAISYICNAGIGYDGPTGVGSISGDVAPGAPGIGGPAIGSGANNTYTQSVTSSGATLAGGVYPNGVATTYSWQYGTTASYGQQTQAASAGQGHGPTSVSSSLTGLAAGTTYHYRLVAQNSLGTSYGYDYTFTTVPAGAPVATSGPTISGTAAEGQELWFSSTWNPVGTSYSIQWKRSTNSGSTWSNISGATGTTYTTGAADVGAEIEVTVTATNSHGTTSSTSTAVGPVTSGAPVATSGPTISGTAAEGQMLWFSSTWNPGGSSYSFQWKRSTNSGSTWSNITGATGTTYTPGAADVGAEIEVTVTGTNAHGTTPATSTPVGPVLSGAPVATSGPTISGTAAEGQMLWFSSTWNPGGSSYSFQWKRSTNSGSTWSNITGATGTTYTPGAADVGAEIEVTVTGTNAYGTTPATSTPVGPVLSGAPVATSGPTISGTAREGQELWFSSTWNPGGSSYAFQWKRSTNSGSTWSNITGATGTTYTPGAADLGAEIEVTVTGTNSYGTTSSTSAPVGPVLSGAPVATSGPTISGSAREGQMLWFSSSWSPGGTSYSIQWKRSTNSGSTWSNITGATGTTYTPGAADLGAEIEVAVTGTNSYGTTSSTSTAVGPVSSGASDPALSSDPGRVGDTVEIAPATVTGPHVTADTVQMMRCTNVCTAVGLPDATSYTIRATDVGGVLRVREKISNASRTTTVWSANYVGPVRSLSSASAVLSVGEDALRNARGTTLADAWISVVGVAADVGGFHPDIRSATDRVVTVRRVHGVRGKLRVWVCPVASTAAGAPQACTVQLTLRSVTTLRVRTRPEEKLRVVVVRTS